MRAVLGLSLLLALGCAPAVFAGDELERIAIPMPSASAPSIGQIHQTVRDYVRQVEEEHGVFTVEDRAAKLARSFTLHRLPMLLTQTADGYRACVQMRDARSSEIVDLDFTIVPRRNRLEVKDVAIHGIDAVPRFAAHAEGNAVPAGSIPGRRPLWETAAGPTGGEWPDQIDQE